MMKQSPNPQELNFRLARRLEEVAQLLESQGANPYRVLAYRRAADRLHYLPVCAGEIFREEGEEGLCRLVGVGERLGHAIATLIMTGKLPMLDRLRGETDPISLLSSVPGIGKQFAARLHRDLHIDTLEQLEAAAHDGRLQNIAGIGAKKLAGIIDSLATRLGRVRASGTLGGWAEPSVAEILDVDREYLEKAAADKLPKIAPRRFNPERRIWLPILHATRGERHYIAMFSNTAHAHEMKKTGDWVILYYDGPEGEHQCTVITSGREPLLGKRIVRGREGECVEYYREIDNTRTTSPSRSERSPSAVNLKSQKSLGDGSGERKSCS